MMFHEIRFPVDISIGATGGPERRTEIVTLGSGREERNTRWANSRRRFNAGYGIKTLDQIHQVIRFFEERRGRLHGFRWRDPVDYKSCPPSSTPSPQDQIIGVGDGISDLFLLTKDYSENINPYQRRIDKPVAGSVVVAVDSVLQTAGSDYSIDEATGVVLFASGNIPTPGALITAGFLFDVPARFDSDYLEINLTNFNAGAIPDIPIVEIRL